MKKHTTRQLFMRLWHERASAYKREFAFAFLLMAVVAASAAAYPALIRHVFEVLGRDDISSTWHEFILVIPPLIIAITLIKGAAMYFQVREVTRLALIITASLQKSISAHLIKADLALVTSKPSGEFVSRIMNDTQLVREAIIRLANNLVRDALTILVLVFMLFWFEWLLALVVLLIYPLALRSIIAIGRRQRQQSKQFQEDLADATSSLTEILQGSRMIRAYALEKHEIGRTANAFEGLYERLLRLTLGKARIDPLLEVLGGLAIAGVIGVASWRIANGAIALSDIVGFVTALLMIVQPARGLGTLNAVVEQASAALERIFILLDTAPQIKSPKEAVSLPQAKGKIRFEGVSFGYGDGAVLEDISFEAKPGEVIALVGASGAGKTTLMNLLPRFYDITKGKITLDGHGIDTLSLEDLRSAMAIVSQDTVLFNDTIANNIRLGRLNASDVEVEEAAIFAAAHDFIIEQPFGYETIVGESGYRLSGGERQRIAIGRAVLKDAPILLLDEATNALDAESEQKINQALSVLSKGRTVLVIAHRLSTVKEATTILVMDGGKIVERGDHKSLIKAKGVYAHLCSLQHFD